MPSTASTTNSDTMPTLPATTLHPDMKDVRPSPNKAANFPLPVKRMANEATIQAQLPKAAGAPLLWGGGHVLGDLDRILLTAYMADEKRAGFIVPPKREKDGKNPNRPVPSPLLSRAKTVSTR